jgi:hypothetical protein
MLTRTTTLATAACALLLIGHPPCAQAQTPAPNGSNPITVPFSEPSRPGTVKVNVMSGSIVVKVGTGRDVIISTSQSERDRDDDRERERDRERDRSRGRQDSDDPSTAGLRRLSQPGGLKVEEENNVISVSSQALLGRGTLTLLVPVATNLELRSVNGGQVAVDGVTGSIDVNNVNGSIRLTNIGGPVTAHATNGQVVATLKQVAAGKPMSFTSFNGNVDVTLPGSAKANLKLRSDRGDVYTDFDVQPTQPPARAQSDARSDDRGRARSDDPKDKAKYRLDMDRSIYGAVNGGGPDFELRTFNGNIYLRKAR